MHCRDCVHYLDSVTVNAPRWGLAGYGYCKAAGSLELRARLFRPKEVQSRDTQDCWLPDNRCQGRKP